MVKNMEFKSAKELVGRSLKVFLKDGGRFHFKSVEAGDNWIAGFDDEGLNLRIDMDDIEFTMGG